MVNPLVSFLIIVNLLYMDGFKFIIDGQQRITSLYVALMGKQLGNVDYASICFNLDRNE